MAFSLNVTTGFVDKTSSEKDWPCDKEPLTVEQVKNIAEYGKSEIALHGNDHNNELENVINGDKKLREWLSVPQNLKMGFASCYSRYSNEQYLSNQWMSENTLYLRASFRIKSRNFIRVMARKIGHIFPLTSLFTTAYHDTVMHDGDHPRIIYSLPVTNEMTVKQLLGLANVAVRENGYLVFMMHSIIDDISNEDPWSYPTDRFVKLCDELIQLEKKQRVEIVTCSDICSRLRDTI